LELLDVMRAPYVWGIWSDLCMQTPTVAKQHLQTASDFYKKWGGVICKDSSSHAQELKSPTMHHEGVGVGEKNQVKRGSVVYTTCRRAFNFRKIEIQKTVS
jgi:hypothetical protein